MSDDDATPVDAPADRLREALGRADALASAANSLIAGLAVDDRVGRERLAVLVEMAAEACEGAVVAARALIAECEGTASGPRPEPVA